MGARCGMRTPPLGPCSLGCILPECDIGSRAPLALLRQLVGLQEDPRGREAGQQPVGPRCIHGNWGLGGRGSRTALTLGGQAGRHGQCALSTWLCHPKRGHLSSLSVALQGTGGLVDGPDWLTGQWGSRGRGGVRSLLDRAQVQNFSWRVWPLEEGGWAGRLSDGGGVAMSRPPAHPQPALASCNPGPLVTRGDRLSQWPVPCSPLSPGLYSLSPPC